jgi:outer membrane receptor for ferrienterochelin and colicins
MFQRIVCICVLLFTAYWAAAQNNIILHCQDSSGRPIQDAFITINNSEQNQGTQTDIYTTDAFTDKDGNANITFPGHPVDAMIYATGYESPLLIALTSGSDQPLIVILKKENNNLEEVVVTGLGRPTAVDKAVSKYKIITAADIRNQGAVTLNDALRNQIGVNIGNDPMLGATISMRGLSGNNVKILVDGLPVNGREAGNIDLSQLNLSNVDRIEIVQGPMSIMYGSDALGGVINLITKKNVAKKTAGLSLFYENIGKYNVNANLGTTLKKHNILLNGGRNFFSGWDPDDSNVRNPLWRPKEQYFGNLKYTFTPSDRYNLTYNLDYLHETLVIKGDPSGYTYDNRTVKDMYFFTQRFIHRLQAKWKTGKNGYWESNNSLANYARNRETRVVDLSTMDFILSPFPGDQTKVVFNDVTSRTTYNNKAGIFNYTFGYDINLQFAKGVYNINMDKEMIGDYALFLTMDIKPLPELTIQPALRGGYNTVYQAPLSPSLGFLYKPNSRCSLRGSYARGFRAPSLKELYLDFKDNNHDIVGNENLKAEYGHHYQLSAGYTVLNKDDYRNTLSLTAYYDDVHNQIIMAQTGVSPLPGTPEPYTYANIGRMRFFTTQFNTDTRVRNIDLNTGLSYNKSISTLSVSDEGITYSTPDFHYFEVNANGTYTHKAWNAGISVFYKFTGKQPMLGADITGSAIFSGFTDSYHNIDASLNKSFWKNRVQLTAGVRNITNNVIINYASGGATGAHSAGGSGLSMTPGRSLFATLNIQITE